jgi:hypothetical protein
LDFLEELEAEFDAAATPLVFNAKMKQSAATQIRVRAGKRNIVRFTFGNGKLLPVWMSLNEFELTSKRIV